jgi:hypothetical protein
MDPGVSTLSVLVSPTFEQPPMWGERPHSGIQIGVATCNTELKAIDALGDDLLRFIPTLYLHEKEQFFNRTCMRVMGRRAMHPSPPSPLHSIRLVVPGRRITGKLPPHFKARLISGFASGKV